jgi:hypothetical protein
MLDDPLCRALNDFYWNVAVKLRSNLVISTIVIVCIDLALIISGYVISESASEVSNNEANDLWQRLFYFVCTMVLVFFAFRYKSRESKRPENELLGSSVGFLGFLDIFLWVSALFIFGLKVWVFIK